MADQIYIFDIDGTISDSSWRSEHAANRDWDTFHSHCGSDKPLEATCRLVRALAKENCVLLLTGRNEKFREITQVWCARHDLRVDDILMRPDKDFRPTEDVKLQLLVEYFGDDLERAKAEVTLIFEDSEKCAEKYRNNGFTVLTTVPGIG